MSEILLAIGAMTLLAFVIGIGLSLGNYYFGSKEIYNEDVEKITKLLPGIDCGICGYINCRGFAKALYNRDSKESTPCRVLKKDAREKLVFETKKIEGKDGEKLNIKK